MRGNDESDINREGVNGLGLVNPVWSLLLFHWLTGDFSSLEFKPLQRSGQFIGDQELVGDC